MESKEARFGPQTPLAGRRVLIADDDEAVRGWLHIVLEGAGASLEEADSGAALLARLTSGHFDLVVTDVRMSWTSGAQVLAMARAAGYRMPFILVTAYGNERLRAEIHGPGAALLEKPLEAERLVALAEKLIAEGPVPGRARERAGSAGAPAEA